MKCVFGIQYLCYFDVINLARPATPSVITDTWFTLLIDIKLVYNNVNLDVTVV